MKLKKFSKNNKNINKIFRIKLIKNKIYSKNFLSIRNNIKVIYSLMVKKKKILFIGNLNKVNFFYKFIINNNLAYVPKNMLLNGFFSNIYVFKHFCLRKKRGIFKFLFNFKLFDFDLIVIFDNYDYNNEILNLNKIPVIFFYNSQTMLLNYHLNFIQLVEKENDIFYFLIYAIFNRYKKII